MKFSSKLLKHVLFGSFVFTSTYLPSVKTMDVSNTITPSVKAITNLYKKFPGKEEAINAKCWKLLELYFNWKCTRKSSIYIKYFGIFSFLIMHSQFSIMLIKHLYNKIKLYNDTFKNLYIKRKKLNELPDLEKSLNDVLGIRDLSQLVIDYCGTSKDIILQNRALSSFDKINDSIESKSFKSFLIDYYREYINHPISRNEGGSTLIGMPICCFIFWLVFVALEKGDHKDFNELYNQTINACLK